MITKQRISNLVTAAILIYVSFVLISRFAAEREVAGRSPLLQKVAPIGAAGEIPKANIAYVFWATWCGPCRVELTRLKDAIESGDLKSEAVVAVSIDDTPGEVESYLKENPLPMRVFWDEESYAFRSLGLSVTPTTVLIDADGKVASAHSGLSLTPAGRIRDHVAL